MNRNEQTIAGTVQNRLTLDNSIECLTWQRERAIIVREEWGQVNGDTTQNLMDSH
jgi:hypothetical protein